MLLKFFVTLVIVITVDNCRDIYNVVVTDVAVILGHVIVAEVVVIDVNVVIDNSHGIDNVVVIDDNDFIIILDLLLLFILWFMLLL